jgi:L-threonylcarbamoyladenylate synthase
MKKTQRWIAGPTTLSSDPQIQEAASLIKAGKTVAFPTETVYGIGCDARSGQAVEAVFAAKGRPNDNPLIVHVADMEQMDGVVDTSNEIARNLMERFWPGPLTVVLPVKPGAVSSAVTAGLNTLAVRMPDHPVALSLIRASGCLVAAPSANRSGRPSPTRAEHVTDDLDGLIDGIVDGGPTGIGLESTVIEIVGSHVHILRPGGITIEQLREVVPVVTLDSALITEVPRSPGMKYTHYAPKGEMTVIKGSSQDKVSEWIQREIDAAAKRGERTGVLTYKEHAERYHADVVIPCGRWNHPEETAHELYHALRKFDQEVVGFILAEACTEEGVGLAVMNRLMKAAGHQVVQI